MRRTVEAVLVLSVFALTAPARPALAQTLWQNTRVGMSVAEVKGLFPNAEPGNRERLYTGAADELRIRDYEIAGEPFGIDFYFAEDKLQEVVLQAQHVKSRDRRSNLDTYGKLVDLLTEKYGRPNGCQTARNITWFQGCEWNGPHSKIDIVYVDIGGQPIVLSIYYQGRSGSEPAEKAMPDFDKL